MDPAHVVLLIATTIAVAAIAGYLIAIILILRHVVSRLVTILGAVQAVTDTSQPVGAIIDDINKDLDAGRKLMEDCVQRLEESREQPVGATAGSTSRHAVAEPAPDPGGGGLSTAALPPAPGPAPPATTVPSPTAAASPPAPTDTEPDRPGEPPQDRKRGWWSR